MIGAFNCQGAGWDPKEHKIRGFPECYNAVSGSVHVSEIQWDQKKEATYMGKAEEYIVYLNQADELVFMSCDKSEPISITLQPCSFELFSFVPLTKLSGGIKFAPIGLSNMFNCGGTIQELDYGETSVNLKVKGAGKFLAYSTISPNKCYLNGCDVAFEWLSDGKLTLNLAWIQEDAGVSDLSFYF